MQHKLDFDRFIQQAVWDVFKTITIMHTKTESNLDRVAGIAASELIKNWGPELAAVFKDSIRVEMERQLEELIR